MNRCKSLIQYAEIIESMIQNARPFEPACEDADHIQVERGLGPIIELPLNRDLIVVDSSGHARPVYRPLLVYSWLLHSNARSAGPIIRHWINRLDGSIWSWLTRAVAGGQLFEPNWCSSASRAIDKLIEHQQPGGAFLAAEPSVNPETRWYDELILLHAVADYSVLMKDHRVEAAVERAALFHLSETQPDHASAQPWGLPGFVRYAPALADQVLHAMMMQYAAGATGVPLLLLADTLHGLRQLISDE